MTQLTISHLSYTYPDSPEALFNDVNLTFSQGWTALIGDNGCGKTTLAHLIVGTLTPDAGSIAPKLVVALAEQDTSEVPRALSDFACDYGQEALEVREILSIEDEWLWRYDTLSAGQKKRIQIALALWQQPDVLIVDEPTNHLDLPSRQAVAEALRGFSGIGLLISHDRALLNVITQNCLFIDAGAMELIHGTYEQGVEERRKAALNRNRDYLKERRELVRIKAVREQTRAKAAQKKGRSPKASPRDSDAREKANHAKATSKDGILTRQVSALNSRLGKLERDAHTRPQGKYNGEIPTFGHCAARSVLVHLASQTIPFGPDAEAGVSISELYVGSSDKIALMGANGVGKTTLARVLIKAVPDDIATLVLPQELKAPQRSAVLNQLHELSDRECGQVLSVAAQLNARPETFLEGEALSPGELRKLCLALAVLQDPALLILDEPTNHLDIHSIEALSHVLQAFPGAVVLISHDQTLLQEVCTVRWEIEQDETGNSRLSLSS